MINSPEFREQCASRLAAAEARVGQLAAFVGLDGFIDEIIHVVSKRQDAETFDRMRVIPELADRIRAAAGKSTNIELVNQRTKLGGNGPIMANALCSLGLRVTYLGALGYPAIHPVFADFARRAQVHSISDSGHTNALEFEDGKIMMSSTVQLNEVNWKNIQDRFGRDPFQRHFESDHLIGFVNWTMIPYMSDLWESLLAELCPKLAGPRRIMFFDLADPEKRPLPELRRALDLIVKFQRHFDVIFGLNEKEAFEIGDALGLGLSDHSEAGLVQLAARILDRVPVSALVVHPVAFALAAGRDGVQAVQGPFCAKPLISTGAGDHFNAGFCLGKLLGLDNAMSVLTGVTTSGYYVRTGHSPAVSQLVGMLRDWPKE